MVGDTLFGLSSRNRGQYFLLDSKWGKTIWTGMPRQAENAAILRAGGVVFSLEDDAELMVGRVSGSQVQEVKRYTVADTATWTAPVVSGRRIFIKDLSTRTLDAGLIRQRSRRPRPRRPHGRAKREGSTEGF